jgi:hypothetical protein
MSVASAAALWEKVRLKKAVATITHKTSRLVILLPFVSIFTVGFDTEQRQRLTKYRHNARIARILT